MLFVLDISLPIETMFFSSTAWPILGTSLGTFAGEETDGRSEKVQHGFHGSHGARVTITSDTTSPYKRYCEGAEKHQREMLANFNGFGSFQS